MNSAIKIDILDIVFQGKNKEYGAYSLRKSYPKNLSLAIIMAVSFFLASISAPLIKSYLSPKYVGTFTTTNSVKIHDAFIESNRNDIKKIEIPVEAPKTSLTKTIKFTVPVIKIDEEVNSGEIMAGIDELRKYDPGIKTQDGTFNPDLTKIELTNHDNSNNSVVTSDINKTHIQAYDWVEEMPSFPGGEEALLKFIGENIQYPEIARKVGVEGRVTVQFIVNSDGKIFNISVLKGIGAGCDEEAVRVISLMPVWKPGIQNGKPVVVSYKIPILFQLR